MFALIEPQLMRLEKLLVSNLLIDKPGGAEAVPDDFFNGGMGDSSMYHWSWEGWKQPARYNPRTKALVKPYPIMGWDGRKIGVQKILAAFLFNHDLDFPMKAHCEKRGCVNPYHWVASSQEISRKGRYAPFYDWNAISGGVVAATPTPRQKSGSSSNLDPFLKAKIPDLFDPTKISDLTDEEYEKFCDHYFLAERINNFMKKQDHPKISSDEMIALLKEKFKQLDSIPVSIIKSALPYSSDAVKEALTDYDYESERAAKQFPAYTQDERA